jgi:hypothetical protein
VVFNANGEIFQPSTARDLGQTLPTDVGGQQFFWNPNRSFGIKSTLAENHYGRGFSICRRGTGSQLVANRQNISSPSGGTINRVRFQAERLNFDGKVWNATNVRLTNDPFSP